MSKRPTCQELLAEAKDLLREMADLLDDPGYTPDSFSSQPARIFLQKLEGDEKHELQGQERTHHRG